MFEKIIRSILDTKNLSFIKQACSALTRVELKPEEVSLLKDINSCVEQEVVPVISSFEDTYAGTVFNGEEGSIEKDAILSSIALLATERRNNKIARELMQIASSIPTEGYDSKTHKKISDLVSSAIQTKEESYQDPLADAVDIYKAKKEQGAGMKFGVDIIDKAIGGIQPGSFNTIFAYTGSYKTLCALNMAYNNSFNNGYNVCYISLEVVKSDIMCNIYSRHSFSLHSPKFQYIPHDKIRNATLTEKEEDFLFNEVIPDFQQKSKGKLYILDESDFDSLSFLGFEKRLREIDELCQRETGKPIDAVFVDQAQLLKYGASGSIGNEGNVINAWVSFFRQQCLDFLGTGRPIAVIMLSQANREGWKRAVKNEGSYDLRGISEANELERASWRIFSIFTNENMKESKEAKVQCLKNRTGLTVMDPVVIFVDPVCYTFGDVGSGFNDSLSVESLDDIFSSEFNTDDIFGGM